MRTLTRMLTIALAMPLTFSAAAQDFNAKLSPWLVQKVAEVSAVAQSRSFESRQTAQTVDVLVKFVENENQNVNENDNVELLRRYGAELLATVGRVHIVRVPLGRVEALAQEKAVVRVEAERAPHTMLDRVPQQIGADKAAAGESQQLPQAFTGKDVVVGIVDAGFDYIHPFFRDNKGTTRVVWAADYMKDTRLTTTAAITAAQHSSDAATMLHGTHVAGIAAGSQVNDVNDVVYRGIATEADIAEAAVDSEIQTDGSGLSSASSVLAFSDIFAYADEQQKPCVINYSMGDAMSFSDNRQLESEAISTLLQKPGRALVVAAGNAGSTMRLAHKEATMAQAGAGVCFNSDEQFGTYFGIELKLLPTQTVTLRHTTSTYKTTKSEATATAQELAGKTKLTLGTNSIQVVNRGQTADGHIIIYITAGSTTFATTERMLVTIGGEGEAWIYADPLCAQLENVTSVENHSLCEEGWSMTWPACLDDVVAVGNIAHRLKILTAANKYAHSDSTDLTPYESTKGKGFIARSSSAGPTLGGGMKPDVCAPGVNVISALNNFIDENTEMEYAGWLISHMDTDYEEGYGYSMTLAQTGTSMSAPAVAGTIALWMQADPTLTTKQIKDIIAHSSRQPDNTLPYPNNLYGHGEIDAYAGLLYMLGLTGIDGLSLEQPSGVTFAVEGKQLTMRFAAQRHDRFTVKVYSTDGRRLLTKSGEARGQGEETTLSLERLPSGVYAVQLTTGDRQTTGSTLIRL